MNKKDGQEDQIEWGTLLIILAIVLLLAAGFAGMVDDFAREVPAPKLGLTIELHGASETPETYRR